MRFTGTSGYVATDDLKVAVNAAATLRRPLLVHVITLAVLAIGLLIVSNSLREGFPAVTINSVQITTVLPGASPEDETATNKGEPPALTRSIVRVAIG